MQNNAMRENDRYARRCSLIGASTGFAVGALTVAFLVGFDVASLNALLGHVATPFRPTDYVILPAALAAVGFAVGPALGGEPPPSFDD
jgi:dolichol kinase